MLATNYVQGATLTKLSIHKGCMLIKWNSPLWPTLVHVHIATEVLDTLHPGATGLCFIIKIWLMTDENALGRCGWIPK